MSSLETQMNSCESQQEYLGIGIINELVKGAEGSPFAVNKAHSDGLRTVAAGYTEEEALIVIEELVKKYPLLIFDKLSEEYNNMLGMLGSISKVMGR